MDQIDFLKFGVAASRKGGLTSEMCLNSKNANDFEKWLTTRNQPN
jgi:hypothetical protein